MANKLLIPLYGNEIAPRFDLATEVLIAPISDSGKAGKEKIIVLPQASAEKLCHLVMTEGIDLVICGGIEDEYYRYLTWKKVQVVDSVIGEWKAALDSAGQNKLSPGINLYKSNKTT